LGQHEPKKNAGHLKENLVTTLARPTNSSSAFYFTRPSHDDIEICVLVSSPHLFQSVAGSMLGVFPMLVMFLITSVATLRENERDVGTPDDLSLA